MKKIRKGTKLVMLSFCWLNQHNHYIKRGYATVKSCKGLKISIGDWDTRILLDWPCPKASLHTYYLGTVPKDGVAYNGVYIYDLAANEAQALATLKEFVNASLHAEMATLQAKIAQSRIAFMHPVYNENGHDLN